MSGSTRVLQFYNINSSHIAWLETGTLLIYSMLRCVTEHTGSFTSIKMEIRWRNGPVKEMLSDVDVNVSLLTASFCSSFKLLSYYSYFSFFQMCMCLYVYYSNCFKAFHCLFIALHLNRSSFLLPYQIFIIYSLHIKISTCFCNFIYLLLCFSSI